MREFLFGNVQIGDTSQGLVFKASCMELGTPHETRSYLHYQEKIRFENEGERDLEKKMTDKIPYSNLCYVFLLYLMLLSLSCLSFFSSLYVFALCVYFLSFCVSRQPFYFFHFSFLCVPLSIYREIPKKLFLYFSLN